MTKRTRYSRDHAVFIATPAGGECCEGFARVGQHGGCARCRLIASDGDVDEERIGVVELFRPFTFREARRRDPSRDRSPIELSLDRALTR
jgi:hypothetical protein